MKLIDAIRNVVIPADADQQYRYNADAESISRSLSVETLWDFPDALDARLKAFPIFNWVCTDEHVGLDALYLDGEPVGCSFREARKSSHEVRWLSKEIAEKVRAVLISYMEAEEFDLINPDEDIGEDYTVSHAGDALTDDGFFEGRPVRALVWYGMDRTTPVEYRREDRAYRVKTEYGAPNYNCVEVLDQGERRIIPMDQFRLAFNVRPSE